MAATVAAPDTNRMSRDTRSRRLTRPAPRRSCRRRRHRCRAAAADVAARATDAALIDLLPHLHQHALDVTGGACSLLFEHNPRNGVLQATSGFGLDELRTDPWIAGPRRSRARRGRVRARRRRRSSPTRDRQMPDLAARLGTPAALLLPLVRGDERVGLLAIGFAGAPDGDRRRATPRRSPTRS